MDQLTLFIVYAAILVACAGSLVITYRQNPSEPGPFSWAVGSVLGAVGLLFFAATSASASLVWLNLVGNVFAWTGTVFYARGSRQHVGEATPPWMWGMVLVALVTVTITVATTPYGKASYVLVGSVVFAVLSADIVRCFVARPQNRSAPGWFIAFFFSLFATTHVIRGFSTLGDLERIFFDRPIDQALVFVGIVGGAATAMGFAMLTTERLLSEKRRSLERLESGVADLRAQFEGLATGDYRVRARRLGTGEPMDVLAELFNRTAEEVGLAFDQLESQRSLLAATLESMVDGLLLLDPSGRVTRSNPSACSLLGTSADALAGRSLESLLAPADHAFARDLMAAVSEAPVRDRTTHFHPATGGTLALTVNASGHRDGAGRVLGAVLVLRDDRDLKEAQARLQMTDRLTAMGTVAAGVAHEINNPLAFVVSNIDYALEELNGQTPLTPEALGELVEALGAARRGGDRVRQIVNDLRTLSRSEGDSTGKVDVNHLVESAAAMLNNEVRHHARLVMNKGAVPPVLANEAKLGQVFLNLVHNAAQAIQPGHAEQNTITVTTGVTGEGRVFVRVEDTGSGIAPENLLRIFDAFFTTKPVGVGTGLGLSICHRIVSGLGGSIEVASEPGNGSRFTVLLPPAVEPAGMAPTDLAPQPKTPDESQRRVLVIDDEVEVGQSIRRILGRVHAVDVVRQASAALLLVESTPYDVILCDLMMPEMTGMEFHQALAGRDPVLAGRVIFMSGGVFSPAAREFVRTCTNRVIEKPFDAQALRSVVTDAVG